MNDLERLSRDYAEFEKLPVRTKFPSFSAAKFSTTNVFKNVFPPIFMPEVLPMLPIFRAV